MYKIGIDIGGTTIKGVLISDDVIIKRASKPTNGKDGREVIKKSLFAVIDALMNKSVTLIGVSSAGNINPYNGTCVYATDNLKGWTGYDIKGDIQSKYGVNCIVDNDAVCALKAELAYYPQVKSAVMITFGTGIGGAVLSEGKIVRGKNFDGGRIGHAILVPNGKSCNCGKNGCAEAYISCTAIKLSAEANGLNVNGVKDVVDLYKRGNNSAQKVINEFKFYLNVFLDNVKTYLSPEVIILGGGLSNDNDFLLSIIDDKDGIVFAKLRNDAGALGALIENY